MIHGRNIFALGLIPVAGAAVGCSQEEARPNILIAIADDQSYPYASAYGSTTVSTLAFDYVASHGILFENAYSTSPGSSPSRASLLTGLFPWQVAEAGTHASSFPSEYLCFPDVFAEAGYASGYTGKGWGPGDWRVSGRKHNPAGPEYNELKCDPPYSGISKIDYAANFAKFLDSRQPGQPFCFWYGSHEPHRPYELDSWERAGRDVADAEVPGFLPDAEIVRGDIMDYAVEISWFDSHLMTCIEALRERRLLDNTIIIVTADNGMSFPHAKANCYDAGVHVPLAICWGDKIKGRGLESALVSLVDIFPTLLDLTGVRMEGTDLSGESLAPLLGIGTGRYASTAVYSGRERHSCARHGNLGYPVRSVRSGNYLLVHNFRPELWPAGDPVSLNAKGGKQDAYYDIDAAPSKSYLIEHRGEAGVKPYFDAAVAMRPEYELFNLADDEACMTNVAGDPHYADVLDNMKKLLHKRLTETSDSRLGDNPEIWESYPRLAGKMREFPDNADIDNK